MPKLLTCKQVCEITGYVKSTIYRLMDEGEFPKALKIGPRAVRWREDEIRAWIESRPRSTAPVA